MPKTIGYQTASKLSSFRIRKKSEDEKSLKKKSDFNPATEKVIQGLIRAGLSRKEAESRVDKGERERVARIRAKR